VIVVQNLSKKFADKIILSEASFHFPEQARIALVGPNGTGKTTFLNMMCGFEESDDGNVVHPRKLRLGYMPQIFNPHPAETVLEECLQGAIEQQEVSRKRQSLLEQMESDFSVELYEAFEQEDALYYELGCHHLDHDAEEVLAGLGFSESIILASPLTLSGGWRMRLELAKILLRKPNFLILDEPTNHLDLPSIRFFEEYMLSFKGTLLFVSHDRELVNRLATHTLFLKTGKLFSFPGNLDALLKKVEEDNAQTEHTLKNIQSRAEKIQSFVDRFRYKPSKAKQVQSRLKMIDRMKAFESTLSTSVLDYEMEFALPEGEKTGKEVYQLDKLTIGYDKPLLKPLSLIVYRGQKIAITGANGLGKSTILKTLLGDVKPLDGIIKYGHNVNIGYFAQENSERLEGALTALDNVLEGSEAVSQFQARSLLGMLGIGGKEALKKVGVMSGGEKSRVALAKLLAQKPNVLLLDEPTNHLDMACETALATALDNFSGTVLFVSHNRSFIQAAATHILWLDQGGVWSMYDHEDEMAKILKTQ